MSGQKKLMTGVVIVLLLVGGGLAWYFLKGKDQDGGAKKVRIGSLQVAIDYAPYLIAKKKGWIEEALKDSGMEIEYLPTFQSPSPTNEAFAKGLADLVLSAEAPTIIGRAADIDVRIAWLSCTLNSEIIVPEGSAVKSLTDLKGKKVAGLAGSGPHYCLIRNLEGVGLSKRDITFVDMLPPDAKAAFETGVVDAWAMFPPWPEQELVAGKGRVLAGVKGPIQVIVVARGKFAEEHPKVVSAFLGALDRAKEWLRKNPEEAQGLVSEELKLPLEVVKLAWPKLDWNARLDAPVIADIQAKADFLKAEGFTRKAVKVDQDLILQTAGKQ